MTSFKTRCERGRDAGSTMTNRDFEVGGVVQLKSGGALMTIMKQHCSTGQKEYTCVWTTNHGGLETLQAPGATLKQADSPSKTFAK